VDPFGGGPNAAFVEAKNYTAQFTQDGLARSHFMQSLGNTFYYVILLVPLQTAAALLLALIVNDRFLRGKSFFRTAFYFPSVTSSIAISTVFLFLFSNTGAVNGLLRLVGINGPQWFSDPRGLLHLFMGLFGAGDNPAWGRGEIFGRSVWDWLSGPSVAMCVIILLAV
jgi:multiple sugar transport system permease protein